VGSQSEPSDLPSSADSGFNAAMVAVIRAPSKNFLMVRQEWAAIRIQTAFRAFLVLCLSVCVCVMHDFSA